ncbi:hypothetical protein [Aquicoccus sp.]|uniref:hypothetical protein n=1 Tax=Aquicoccus sp. TaxID=2055851 RepID=UPI003568187F
MSYDVKWIVQRGYSIDAQLIADGLSFDAFDLIERSTDAKTSQKIKNKIVGRLAKEFSSDCLEQGLDVKAIQYGCYCIAVGTGFEVDYNIRSSRIVYVGSGSVYGRIKSHLAGKLFDFASILRSIPLRFYVCDLSGLENGKLLQRSLEQKLLKKFHDEIDTGLPLLNSRNAKISDDCADFDKGWDYPVQKERGAKTTNWLLKPYDTEVWKGAL